MTASTRSSRSRTSSVWSTASRSGSFRLQSEAARSAKRPGSPRFMRRMRGTSSGTRSTRAASPAMVDRMRSISGSAASGSSGVSFTARGMAV